jgi:hypothetical protein
MLRTFSFQKWPITTKFILLSLRCPSRWLLRGSQHTTGEHFIPVAALVLNNLYWNIPSGRKKTLLYMLGSIPETSAATG